MGIQVSSHLFKLCIFFWHKTICWCTAVIFWFFFIHLFVNSLTPIRIFSLTICRKWSNVVVFIGNFSKAQLFSTLKREVWFSIFWWLTGTNLVLSILAWLSSTSPLIFCERICSTYLPQIFLISSLFHVFKTGPIVCKRVITIIYLRFTVWTRGWKAILFSNIKLTLVLLNLKWFLFLLFLSAFKDPWGNQNCAHRRLFFASSHKWSMS